MFQQARVRAKRKGVPFDLTISDVQLPAVCPILGMPLTVNDGRCGSDSFSLDRIIPERGYVKGNVRVISFRANTIKSNATLEELKAVVSFLEAQQPKNS